MTDAVPSPLPPPKPCPFCGKGAKLIMATSPDVEHDENVQIGEFRVGCMGCGAVWPTWSLSQEFALEVWNHRVDSASGGAAPSASLTPTREQVEALLWKDNGTSFATPIHNGAIRRVLTLFGRATGEPQ